MTRFVEQEQRQVTRPGLSYNVVRIWEGPTEDLASFLATEIPAGWIERSEIRTVGKQWYRVEATYLDEITGGDPADAGLVERSWQRSSNYAEKPLVLCPNALRLIEPVGASPPAEFAAWPGSIVQAAQRYHAKVRQYVSGDTTTRPDPSDFYAILEEFEPASSSVAQKGLAVDMWQTALKNPDMTFEVSEPVLRKVEIVTNATVLRISSVHVNRFWSRAALAATEPTLPIQALVDWAGLASHVWLKRDPHVDQVNGGLLQLSQEYWGALEFEEFVYGTLIV